MTIILGLLDKIEKKTYIACDGVSSISSGEVFTCDKDKIIEIEDKLLIGFSGLTLISDIVNFHKEKLLNNLSEENFLSQFRINLLKIFETEKYPGEDGKDSLFKMDACAVVAFGSKLFYCSGSLFPTTRKFDYRNYQITPAGCGDDIAKAWLAGAIATNTPKILTNYDLLIRAIEYAKLVDHHIAPSIKTTIKTISW